MHDIIDINDFLDQYGLSQCEADSLFLWIKKDNKKEIFKILNEQKVNPDKHEDYYKIFRKEVTKTFEIIEDKSFLENDENFQKLKELKFMFSVGAFPIRGMFYDNMLMDLNAERYSREEIKQIWIIKDIL